MPPETLGQHRHLRGHAGADRCCGKSLIGSALVRFSARQHARGASISKRAPSTTRTSLRFRINELRAVLNSVAQNAPSNLIVQRCDLKSAVCSEAGSFRRRNCVRPSNLLRSLTAILLRRADTCAQSHIADVAVLAYPPSFGPSRGTNHLIGSALRAGTTTVSHPARPVRVLLEILPNV